MTFPREISLCVPFDQWRWLDSRVKEGKASSYEDQIRSLISLAMKASPPAAIGQSLPHSLPESWKPNMAHEQLAYSLGVSVKKEADRFRDWADATGAVMADWDARFRAWLKKAAEYKTTRPELDKPQTVVTMPPPPKRERITADQAAAGVAELLARR